MRLEKKDGLTAMTMNADISGAAVQTGAGQSWCAGPVVLANPTRTAAPSWLAPYRIEEDESATPDDPPLLAIDADAEMRESVRPGAMEEARQSLAEIALLPRSSPVISLAAEAAPQYPDLREENAELRRTIEALTRELSRVRVDVREASEAELVRLACAVAERVVGAELSTDPGHIVAWAREGIDALDAKETVVVALAPDLARAVPTEEWSALGANVTVEVDPSLPASSCEVRSRTGLAKVSTPARMAQVRTALGANEDGR